jgi:hypothetical protein
MNVVDLPEPCTRSLYEEAISRYASMVKSRAVGIHRVGNVRYPGLSDIDLLVVTDHESVDNRFFFAARQRLPQRYHRLFLHEPFILPAWSLRVMRYTTHGTPDLVAGRDVLKPYTPSDEPAERWCRMLESYCSYAAFVERTRSSQVIRGRLTVAVANAFRFLLSDAAVILPEAADQAYVDEVEALRATFFEAADRAERVRAAWTLFANAFERFDAVLQRHLGAQTTNQAVKIARARIHGDESCDDFDRGYAFRRAQEIDGYHQELASLGFPFGHLFFIAAHPHAVRTLPRQPVVDTVLRNVYRVRRRLTEYAPGV